MKSNHYLGRTEAGVATATGAINWTLTVHLVEKSCQEISLLQKMRKNVSLPATSGKRWRGKITEIEMYDGPLLVAE